MTCSIRFRRAALLAGASMAFVLGLAPGFGVQFAGAASGKRLAYSQRLGAEIFAVGSDTDWCQEQVTIQIIADSKALFGRPDFETLIKSLGSKVLATECPAARRLIISGLEKDTGQIAWTGQAGNGDWKPVQAAAAASSSPPSAVTAGAASGTGTASPGGASTGGRPPIAETRPAAPALPVPSSPLGGEWTGQSACDGYNRSNAAVTLSVFEVSGNRFKGVWEKRPPNGAISRLYVDGQFDDLTNQIRAVTAQNGKIRGGYNDSVELIGTLDAKGGQINAHAQCYGENNLALSRRSATPTTAHRVLTDAASEKAWTEEENGRLRDWWIVGKLPKGQFRAPSCSDLAAWAEMFPAELRVRLFTNSNGMLRHFDDATTQRVFGSPAYYWLGADDKNILHGLAREACGNAFYSNNPQMRQLRTVVEDYNSVREVQERRRYNRVMVGIAPYLATRGDEPADAVAYLNRFASLEGVEQNLQEFQINPQSLSPEEKMGIAKDVVRYKAKLADKAGQAKVAEIVALPATLDSLDRIAKTKADAVSLFGKDAAATVVAAADERRTDIAKAVVTAAIAELDTTPRSFEGMMDADLKTSAIREKLGAKNGKAEPIFEPMLRDLEAAETRYRQETRDTVIKAAQASIPTTPATFDGARALVEHARGLEKALGKDAGPGFAAYQKAVTAKVGEIGMSVVPELKGQLDKLPTAWTSIAGARKLAAEYATQVAGTPAEAAFTKAGEERVQTILAGLADQAILDVKGVQSAGLKGIDEALLEARKAATPFEAVDGGKPLVENILEAGRKRANEIGEAYVPEFRIEVKNAPASRFTAIQMAAASIVLEEHGKDIPAMAKLRDVARDGAVTMHAGVCDKALSDAGIGASDGKTELLVGSDITTLKQFVCDLRESGIRATKLETPGLMKSITGGEKEYVLRLYGPENRLQLPMLKNGAFALRIGRRFAAIDDLFDFGGVKDAEDASAKNGVESPAKIVFKEMEIRQDRRALVGVQFGDDAKTESLSLREWREVSTALSSFGKDGANPAKICASWAKSGPKELDPYEAGLALLTCQTKK